MKKYDEKSIIMHLHKHTPVIVEGVFVKVPRAGVGIHTWGKIDYLTRYCGYAQTWK